MIYALAIILTIILALLVTIKTYATQLTAWIQYQCDKASLRQANRSGDLNAIRHYAQRVREYRTRTKS